MEPIEVVEQATEYYERVNALVAKGMSRPGAEAVIKAVMFGYGCIPEKYRGMTAADITS